MQGVRIQGNPLLKEGPGQRETEIDCAKLQANVKKKKRQSGIIGVCHRWIPQGTLIMAFSCLDVMGG